MFHSGAETGGRQDKAWQTSKEEGRERRQVTTRARQAQKTVGKKSSRDSGAGLGTAERARARGRRCGWPGRCASDSGMKNVLLKSALPWNAHLLARVGRKGVAPAANPGCTLAQRLQAFSGGLGGAGGSGWQGKGRWGQACRGGWALTPGVRPPWLPRALSLLAKVQTLAALLAIAVLGVTAVPGLAVGLREEGVGCGVGATGREGVPAQEVRTAGKGAGDCPFTPSPAASCPSLPVAACSHCLRP